ncbi:fimbrillin family protein [Parabacteroides goldsteinii]|uniref:fimbrillin family protein n=1 Tax=Parabacteroides goldsteinii TaxID=328812 RepID=UPI00241C3695|nr:fimbrillin family protein [Parabacteroides goldsteinii]
MKTLVLSMISIAATVAAMTACTSESDPIKDIQGPKNDKVEIKLTAGVANVETKASPVKDAAPTEFADGTNIQLIRWDHEGTLADLTWGTDTYTKVSATASGTAIDFISPQYYNEDGKSTSFIGFYPALTEGSVTLSDGTVQFTGLNGQTDILSAELVNVGSQASVETGAEIKFKHMLSQIKFKLSGTSAADETFGKIKKISLSNIATNLNMTLGKNTEATKIIVPADATKEDLTVLDVMDEAGVSITSLKEEYTIMIPPELGSSDKNIEIKIETTTYNGDNSLKVNANNFGDTGIGSGTANEITLTFKDKITVTTAIADWSKGQDKNYGIE